MRIFKMTEEKLKKLTQRWNHEELDEELSELMSKLFTTPPIPRTGGIVLDENPCAPECWCRRTQRAD